MKRIILFKKQFIPGCLIDLSMLNLEVSTCDLRELSQIQIIFQFFFLVLCGKGRWCLILSGWQTLNGLYDL